MKRTIAVLVLGCFFTVFVGPPNARAEGEGGGESGVGIVIVLVPLALLGAYVLFSGGHAPWEKQRTDVKAGPGATAQALEHGPSEAIGTRVTKDAEARDSKRRPAFDLASMSVRF